MSRRPRTARFQEAPCSQLTCLWTRCLEETRHVPEAETMRMQGTGKTQFRDTTGFVFSAISDARVRLERYRPDALLGSVVDHYWYLDWAVDQPFLQEVIPPPAVNIVFH